MLQMEKWKMVLVMLVCVLGIAYATPNMLSKNHLQWLQAHAPSWFPTETVNLGLDLQGGSHLLLQADIKSVIAERMDGLKDGARSELRKKGIGYIGLTAMRDGITFRLRNPAKDHDAAYAIARDLERSATVNIADDGTVTLKLGEKALKDIETHVIDQSIEIVRRRVDETGTKEPLIQRSGDDRIVLELPGIDNPEHVKELLKQTAKMSFHLLDENATSGQVGPDSMKVKLRDEPGRTIIVRKKAPISGEMLTDAEPSFDMNGQPVVSFKLDSLGAKRFCDITRANVGKPFAIVLDNEVITYPRINTPICGGNGQISGGFDVKGATDLALLLRAGALPATLSFVEERTVGPTLGSDSVAAGKTAAMYAFAFVFILIWASYGLFGLFANIALALNMVFIFALLSMLQATLTLPGIAGIILTIGIAVDANVLVYERIREELREGRSVISAIDKGYLHAKATIIDANLTTLIVAIILFSFGTGPVKGFAVSMTIGIITSIFCALMVTRMMVLTWLRKTRPSTLDL
ncbi:MAG: protein translocase subunit SecD [Alphaproteobacteria bacterium]|nr:protein translocase subunit SecD [Alphaproteobacteria bacterium]